MKQSIFKEKKWIIFAIFIILIIFLLIVIWSVVQEKKKEMEEIQKIESEYNGEFAYDRITVLTSKERKEMNKEYTLKEFSEMDFLRIENLNVENEAGDFLILYLKNASKENVLKAVYRLKSNPSVIHCELNGIESIY